jgi:hypothetical protein
LIQTSSIRLSPSSAPRSTPLWPSFICHPDHGKNNSAKLIAWAVLVSSSFAAKGTFFSSYRRTAEGTLTSSLKLRTESLSCRARCIAQKSGAENGIESGKKNAPIDGRYERKVSASWQPDFVLEADNLQKQPFRIFDDLGLYITLKK